MKDQGCSKGFPKAFTKETQMGNDGYPQYCRRSPEDGGFEKPRRKNSGDIILDGLAQPMMMNNSWTFPYLLVLLKAFKCHINVELCQTIQAIKYLFKYVHKGSDMAVISLQNPDQPPDPHQYDQIKKYQMPRYMCTGETI